MGKRQKTTRWADHPAGLWADGVPIAAGKKTEQCDCHPHRDVVSGALIAIGVTAFDHDVVNICLAVVANVPLGHGRKS